MIKSVPLSEVVHVAMGSAPPGESYNVTGQGVPMIAGAGDYGAQYPQPKKWTTAPTRVTEIGDLIVCVRATIGDLNWADKIYCLGRGVAGLRAKEGKLDIKYAAHYINSKKDELSKLGAGSTFLAIRRNDLEEFPIPLPPLGEQKRIAAILDRADAIRRKRQQAIKLADDFLRATFLDMFGDPVTNPKRWPRVPLKDVLSRIDSGWSPKCSDRSPSEDEWGVLKLGSVTTCEFIDKESKALPSGLNPRPELEVKYGDLLFTRKNTYDLVAACALVHSTRSKLMLSDLIFRLKIKDKSKLNRAYLWALLTHAGKRKQIQGLAGGAAGSMPNISKSRLLEHEIEVPDHELQEKFDFVLSKSRSIKNKVVSGILEAELAFNSLTQRAFRGEL